MNKVLKFPWEERHRHFWVSDLHTFHNPQAWDIPIWKQRGYSSFEECSEDQIEKINTRVGKDDILWNLGDNFLNAKDADAIGWWGRINCKNIHYLWGNHESVPYRLYRQEVEREFGRTDIEVYPIRYNNVVFYGKHLEVRFGKTYIAMNHFPLRNWNHCARGAINLHGHSHNNDETRNPDYPMGKTLDCGWDWKKDVWSFEEIMDVVSTKTIEITDHDRVN